MKLSIKDKTTTGVISFFAFIVTLAFPFLGWGQTTFNYSGSVTTYTVPGGTYCLQVQVYGGGGAGGSRTENQDGAGGGGGGGYTFALINVTPGQIINLYVGAGGAPVTGNNNGNPGQNSWFVDATSNIGGGGAGGTWGTLTTNGTGGAGGTGTYTGGVGGIGRDNGAGTGGGGGSSAGTASNGNAGGTGASGGAGGIAPVGGFAGGNGGGPNVNGVTGGIGAGGGGSGSDEGAGDRLGGSGGNGRIIVTPINICDTYCTNDFPAGVYSITNVNFSTINNASAVISGGASPDSENFLGTCASVTQGTTYPITVNATGAGAANTFYVSAFFDWNSDGDFTDSDERYNLGTFAANAGTVGPFNINIPCTSTLGNIQMRVISIFGGYADPCNAGGNGQAENYCITIVAATAPISNAGSDQNISCASSATLNSTLSNPATGYWTLVSGTGTITTPTSQSSTVTGMANGANVFEWTATGICSIATDQVTINISGLPDVPVSAGNDIFTCTQGLTLNGTDPAPFTGTWVVVSGPNVPTFTPGATTFNAAVSGMIAGTYVLSWQVNAGACGILSDNMTFTFGSLPTPLAGPDQTICPTGAVLAGNSFSGATGTWSVFSGPAGSGFVNVNDPLTTIHSLVPGVYVLNWTTSGGGCGAGSSDAVTITVNNCTIAVTHGTSGSQTFTGCSYSYTDDGGAGANYSNNIAQTWTTFCPDDPNDFSTLTFNTSSFYPGDYLVVYDDPSVSAPIVAAFFYDNSPGGGPVQSPTLGTTITSSTGCLYVQMNTTVSNTFAGFTATVGCSPTAGIQNQTFVTPNNCGGGGGITLCASGPVATDATVETNPPDLGTLNQGCLGSQEGASNTWVYMTAETDGYISFQIDPAGGQDFDYAVWGPYPGGYSCPGASLDDPIRCSWATNGGAGCPATIGIGILDATGGSVLPGDVSENGACTATNEGWTYPILASAGDVYVLLFQNYGFNSSSFDFTVNSDPTKIPPGGSFASLGCDPPLPLPVELISFIGENKNRINYLYWNTASEYQNNYFTIERSFDGLNWSVLGNIEGAKFSSEMRHYSIIDQNPYNEITYYRLIQVDFDGTKRNYKTIAITTEIEIISNFSDLFPNPTDQTFYFNYGGSDFNSEIIINAYNSAGQLVITKSFNDFNKTQSLQVETSELPFGLYQIEIIQNEMREMKKISIVH